MSSALRGVGAAGIGNDYALEDILKATQSPQSQGKGGGFRKILGSVAGGVGNIFAPGLGTAIAGLIGGGKLNSTGLLGDTTQFLELQRQMNMESRAFETASAVMKARHDAAMSAIRNIK